MPKIKNSSLRGTDQSALFELSWNINAVGRNRFLLFLFLFLFPFPRLSSSYCNFLIHDLFLRSNRFIFGVYTRRGNFARGICEREQKKESNLKGGGERVFEPSAVCGNYKLHFRNALLRNEQTLIYLSNRSLNVSLLTEIIDTCV